MASGSTADVVVVGLVRRAHGVRGEVLVEVLTDVANRFDVGAELLIREGAERLRSLRIASARPHQGCLLVQFEGLSDRDAIEPLRGADLLIPAERLSQAPEGAYFYFDLIGSACVDRRVGALGEVAGVREDGGGLLLEVRSEREVLLVPFVREYLVSVDSDNRLIELDLPHGLVETCTSRS